MIGKGSLLEHEKFQTWRCTREEGRDCPPEGCPKSYGCAREHGWKSGDPSPPECTH